MRCPDNRIRQSPSTPVDPVLNSRWVTYTGGRNRDGGTPAPGEHVSRIASGVARKSRIRWETGDPVVLGTQLARLSRLAYRIVWANPRTASPRYRPLVGRMAAAWPHCDAVVSAHRLAAVPELVAALADPVRTRGRTRAAGAPAGRSHCLG